MASEVKGRELFTASQVAQFCQVDLKTIHNWAERGEIRHFRTPGRHLRFRRVDVLDFLRKYGYPIPEELQQGTPRVVLLGNDSSSLENLKQELGTQFDVTIFHDAVDALLAIGLESPDVVIVDEAVTGLDVRQIAQRLQAHEPTRHVRTLLFGATEHEKDDALNAGVAAYVVKPRFDELRQTLQALLGLAR